MTSVEVDADLAATVRERLEAGVDVEVGDGAAGWPQGAPYDRVISMSPSAGGAAVRVGQVPDRSRSSSLPIASRSASCFGPSLNCSSLHRSRG
ncbi:hypothetical protein [Streptomyces sp. NPDC051776]|uniref:hypothetical protein n=1 Tax=Streptomyces sp. NPDC051776 TaxID=3155414 RepID=UPI003422690E